MLENRRTRMRRPEMPPQMAPEPLVRRLNAARQLLCEARVSMEMDNRSRANEEILEADRILEDLCFHPAQTDDGTGT